MVEKSGINCELQKDGSVILYYLPQSVEAGNLGRLFIGKYAKGGHTFSVSDASGSRLFNLPE